MVNWETYLVNCKEFQATHLLLVTDFSDVFIVYLMAGRIRKRLFLFWDFMIQDDLRTIQSKLPDVLRNLVLRKKCNEKLIFLLGYNAKWEPSIPLLMGWEWWKRLKFFLIDLEVMKNQTDACFGPQLITFLVFNVNFFILWENIHWSTYCIYKNLLRADNLFFYTDISFHSKHYYRSVRCCISFTNNT